MIRIRIVLACVVVCGAGCGYEGKARTRVGVSKLSGSAYIDSSKDDTIDIDEVSVTPATTTQPAGYTLKGLHVNSNASVVNPTIANLVDANARLTAVHGDNIERGINAVGGIVGQVMPVLGQRIAAKRDVALGKLASQQAITEAVMGVISGQVHPNDVLPLLDPREQNEFKRRLDEMGATLAGIKAQPTPQEIEALIAKEVERRLQLPVTTQPTASRPSNP